MSAPQRSTARQVYCVTCALLAIPACANPLFFEQNLGQAGAGVRFIARDSGASAVFRAGGVDLPGAVTFEFAGADRHAAIQGEQLQPGRVSYYLGSDPHSWRTGIPAYAALRYRDLYPGIDARFYRGPSGLEYDLVLKTHAELSRVRLRFRGARRVFIDSRGDLRIVTPGGEIRQPRPRVFQDRELRAAYFIDARGDVGFSVPGYRRDQPLTIDPQIVYATYFGGSGDDTPLAERADASGNVYVLGNTTSAGAGSSDAYVIKLDPTGQTLLYKAYIGGSARELSQALAIDSAGNTAATGYTTSTDFPTLHAFQNKYTGASESFVFKLDPQGKLAFSTYLGGSQPMACGCYVAYNSGRGIDMDRAGNIYVGGETAAADFPTTAALPNHTPDGGEGYLAEFSPSGSLLFSAMIGGSAYDGIHSVAVDPSTPGAVYVTGDTLSTDLPLIGSPYQSKQGTGSLFGDTWIGRIDTNRGSGFLTASTYYGGSADDEPYSIALDSAGNVIISGETISQDLPLTPNAPQRAFGGGSEEGDGYVAKFDPSLSHLLFAAYIGGPLDDHPARAIADAKGDIWIAGAAGAAFPSYAPTADALQPAFGGGYLLKLDPAQGSVLYFSYSGAAAGESVAGLDIDSTGRVYTASSASSANGGARALLTALDFSGAPAIQAVNVAWGGAAISPNAWIEIHGRNLSNTSPRAWQASDFAAGQMPVALDQVDVQVNGKAAFVYYVSPTQVNVLTPLDSTIGPVEIRLWNRLGSSQPFIATMQSVSPAIAENGANRVFAQHADGSAVTSQSPAHAGENVLLLAFGLGVPRTPLQEGVFAQSGSLPSLPTVRINGANAAVDSAGLTGAGLYQVKLTVPSGAVTGDNPVTLIYQSVSAQSGLTIPIQ